MLLPDRTTRPRIDVRLSSVVGFVEESCFSDSGVFEGVDVAGREDEEGRGDEGRVEGLGEKTDGGGSKRG